MPNNNYERVVIGIDPHKASWTAAAVNSALQPVATIRVPVSRAGYRTLRKFAAQWPAACRIRFVLLCGTRQSLASTV